MVNWLGEIDLGTTGAPVSMGVRKLGERPWLVTDEYRDHELSLKSELALNPDKTVFLTLGNAEQASSEVVSLITDSGPLSTQE